MARDIGEYQSGLTLFRQELIEPWVSWFADAVTAAANRSTEVLGDVAQLQERWRRSTSDLRADAGARRLCELLPGAPVLNSATAAALLGITEQAARNAIGEFRERGILTDSVSSAQVAIRRRHWYVAHELLSLLVR